MIDYDTIGKPIDIVLSHAWTKNDLSGQHLLLNRWIVCIIIVNMGFSKNRGTPKWMVYNEKPY